MCLVAAMHGLRFLLEQPRGSFLEALPEFQWLWGVVKAGNFKTVTIYMFYRYITYADSRMCVYENNYIDIVYVYKSLFIFSMSF